MTRAIAWACALGVAVVTTAACSSGGGKSSPTTTASPTTIATTVPTTLSPSTTRAASSTAPSTTSRTVLSGTSRLSPDGLGPIKVGMTFTQAKAAAGVPLAEDNGPFCSGLMTTGEPQGVVILGVSPARDRVAIISLSPSATIQTTAGVGIGSREADVTAAYPGTATVVSSPGPLHRIYVQAGDNTLSFSIASGKVITMEAGVRSEVELDEACA